MLILHLCSFSNYRKESKMSQAPVSNCASRDILPENSTQAMEISQFAYETSLAWGKAGNRRPKKEEIPGADEDILGIKLPKFLAAMTMYRGKTPLTICQFQMATVISLVFSSAQRVSTLKMMYVMRCQKAILSI